MERPSSTGAGPVLSRPGVGSTVLIPEAMRMSARDTRADDLANQKKNLPLNLSGWVRKRGRSFRVKYLRYMRLQNKFLSNHRNEFSAETWSLNMRECTVNSDAQKRKISISKPGQHVRLFPLNDDDFLLWCHALQCASSSDSNIAVS
ncbi:hypothetical protein FVE85_6072 [Porphyridium purpureum]|uniref:PH domain-containing protein n=1 Tax=Porphyridium purpureum TaxID=35688 RepID=A0A5J4Z725_PORPP|nr:hypothetical protein FVE85_6072 [Porphyridium purpureum]|eukprot:POR6326..scf295_1